jgi:hypothetical protein
MDLQLCYTVSEDTFPLPRHFKERYGPFGFPAPADARRPYISSNFVMGLDGRASFRELEDRTDGNVVSRSREDRWLMDFLRAHHDAQLIGASTLREELNPAGRGWDYGIDDEELHIYRQDALHLRTRVGYAGVRNGLNFCSALAAKTKSLSVRPLILCDQISILHFPQAKNRSG